MIDQATNRLFIPFFKTLHQFHRFIEALLTTNAQCDLTLLLALITLTNVAFSMHCTSFCIIYVPDMIGRRMTWDSISGSQKWIQVWIDIDLEVDVNKDININFQMRSTVVQKMYRLWSQTDPSSCFVSTHNFCANLYIN